MDQRAALLKEIETFIAAQGMPPTTFGKRAVNDPHLLRRLRDGGDVTLQTADRLRRFMQDAVATEGAS